MSSTVYENPLFFKDLSPGIIKYHNDYPFIEYENKTLSNTVVFGNLYGVTLRDAKKKTILEPDVIGMLFTYSSLTDLSEDITGDAILYSSGSEIISSDSSTLYKYIFYLKKNQEGISESFWYANYEDDYQGEYDYVTISVPENNLEKIKTGITELNANLNNNLENNKPVYTGDLTHMYNDKINQTGQIEQSEQNDLTNYGVEFYFYVWESMNGPWFTNRGDTVNLTPLIKNIADETGVMNLHDSNADYTNSIGLGHPNDRTGLNVYTLNYTTDYRADTSSNYVKIYRITPDNNELFPSAPKINIISPKFSTFYYLWTYRYVNCGNIVIYDMGSDTLNGQERTIPLAGVPPLFTPGVKIAQEDIENVVNWNWDHLTFSTWGENINNYGALNIERIFKPKRQPTISYLNQKIKITIPPEEIEDLSRNFINRYKPDRPAPRYKTWEGEVYIHPYEDNEIIKTWYNIHIFKNTIDHSVLLTDGVSTTTIPNIKNIEIPQEIIYCEFKFVTEVQDELSEISQTIYKISLISDDDVIRTLYKGNKYIITINQSEFQQYPVKFSLTEDGTNKIDAYEYKYGITYNGDQGLSSGNIIIDVTYDYPYTLYYYTETLNNIGDVLNVEVEKNTLRDFSTTTLPYTDKFIDILSDEMVDLSDNEYYLETIEDCNLDYFDVEFSERGELANKKIDDDGNFILDEDGNLISTDLSVEDKVLAEQRTLSEPEWFAYEEYTPDSLYILRSYLEDYITLPKYCHILDVLPGSGWFVRYKKNESLPKTSLYEKSLVSNVYYIRWTYLYRKYHYAKTDYTNPQLLSYDDISFNNGISPSSIFDFSEYGKKYIPRQVIFTYSNKEYPDKPKLYYKNLNISVNVDELLDLSKNIVYNTDLGCSISLQIYVMKPKNRLDRDQQDPPMDLSSNLYDTYDLSFNLTSYPNRLPSTISIDISDNDMETTLLPGRYMAIWSYDVIHNFINPDARSYPLIPGIDYDASVNYFDIGYNDFLYDNNEPIFQFPTDLTRMSLEIQGIDISGILNMRDTYLHTLSDETEIKFNFLLWSPNYEWTQLLSGNRRWELPFDFKGEDDIRIKQVPTEYMDINGLLSIQKCYLGNDNSDTEGSLYDWGFGGEPGIQYRKVTYNNIANNEVYNRRQFIDIDTNNVAIEIDSSYWLDPNAVNFIIDFYLPASDLSTNTANWGFGSGPQDVLTFSENSFHIGINSNGIDDIDIETPTGLPVQQLGFIYKPPYTATTELEYMYKHRLESNREYKIRYKLQECNIFGQEPSRDVTISIDDEIIYDIPGAGIQISDIKWLGQTYDELTSPIPNRPYRIEVWYMDNISSKTLLKDLSNTTLVQNTWVPQDFDINDTETALYQSQNYETRGLYIPYISRWEYEILDPCSNVMIKSSILKTSYPNNINRVADWKIAQQLDGGEEFDITHEYPFTHKYMYATLYSIPEEFIPPLPMYPTQYLDVSYNETTRDLVVTFDKEKIVYPLMYNLLDYWKLRDSETEVKYIIYAWYPNSTKLPSNYIGPEDIADYNLWENVYDISFTIVSSNPYQLTNILPKIPHNIFKISETDLIYGKWVLAWNYHVNNYDFDEEIKSMPDYGFFDVSAVEIDIPPILYSPKSPLITYIDEPIDNQILKIEIPNKQLLDLSKNITTHLKGLQDVSSVEISFYLWAPHKEITYNQPGWELPDDYYGKTDQRIYAFPVVYIDQVTNLHDVYYDEEQIGFDISYAFVKKLEKTINNNYTDLSCVYFTHDEIFPDGDGNLPYSDVYKKSTESIPYIARWSYEIKRTTLPSYYSDISSNPYYRNYNWNVLETNNGKIFENYEKIVRYNYATLFTEEPIEPPTEFTLESVTCNSCAESKNKTTKTQEVLNSVMRNKIILENFKYAKRLRDKPLSLDPKVTQHVTKTGDTNIIVKIADNSVCPDNSLVTKKKT